MAAEREDYAGHAAAVRREMRGIGRERRYMLISTGGKVIGIVRGRDSFAAYAVPLTRTPTQWKIDQEEHEIVLKAPRTRDVTAGRVRIVFEAAASAPGSSYPSAALWIDARHVPATSYLARESDDLSGCCDVIRWSGRPRLTQGEHVIVAGVQIWGTEAYEAWVVRARGGGSLLG